MGSQLLQTAMFWQIFDITGSAILLGLNGLARAAPHMLLSLVGGVIADRLNRVHLIQWGQVLNAILLVTLGLLTIMGMIEIWHLYAITFLNSGFSALTQPARTALIPSLVPRDRLVNAVGLNASVGQVSQILGPALAGIGIAMLGLGSVYILNAVFYGAAIIAILGITVKDQRETISDGPWRSFLEGLGFVRQRPVILSLLIMDLSAVVLGSYRALLPIFAELLGTGAAGYGLLSAAPGVGSLLGAAFILSLGDMRYKGLYTVFGVLSYSAALALMALSPWFWLTLIAAGLLGVTNTVQMIPRNSVILGISPDALRGRVEAFRSMLAGGGPPLGYTLSGAVAAVFGAPLAVLLGAITCSVVVVGVALKHQALRDPHLGVSEEHDSEPP